jgi:hypothetical protein
MTNFLYGSSAPLLLLISIKRYEGWPAHVETKALVSAVRGYPQYEMHVIGRILPHSDKGRCFFDQILQ